MDNIDHSGISSPFISPSSSSSSPSIPSTLRSFVLLLCLCSAFLDFRPSEPYITPYLIDDIGLGAEAVNESIYPVWTYSYFALLLPVGLIGEMIGYRPMVIIQMISLLATYIILIWCSGLRWMQFMQVTFGFASAVQSCIFYTYIYTCCEPRYYHRVVR